MARFDLSGRVALIAGASRGIGEAIAHGFAEHGATVICTSRKIEACQKVGDDIVAKGGKASAKMLHLGNIETQWLTNDAITALHSFGKQVLPKEYQEVTVNKLHEPVLYKYYLNGRWDLY